MEILVNLDVMMAKRKISAGELAERVGITPEQHHAPARERDGAIL